MKKTILFFLFCSIFCGCVSVKINKEKTQTFELGTTTTYEGVTTYVLSRDSIPVIFSKDMAIQTCLPLGNFFLLPSSPEDSTNEETLFFQDSVLGIIRPFPVLGGWSGWEENILYLYPNISSRMIYVVIDMKEDIHLKKKTRVVRSYWIDYNGKPDPLGQTKIKRGLIYKGDMRGG